jgi:GH15 family glucan-1,4-alpha-glucosidase
MDIKRKQWRGHALKSATRVWFTLSHGIFNEIYYPRLDDEYTRDCGFHPFVRES